jgi:hypothetical protein
MLALSRVSGPLDYATTILVYLAWFANVTRAFLQARQSIHWPTTTGTLEWFDANPDPSRCRLHLVYRYRVGDREYKSTQYRITSFSFMSMWLGTRYPWGVPQESWRAGMDLCVHYHPHRPQVATIEVGPSIESTFVVFVHMVAGVGIGLAALIKLLMRL